MQPIAELEIRTNEAQPENIGVRLLLGDDDRWVPLYFQADTCIVHNPHTDDEQVIWVGGHVWEHKLTIRELIKLFHEEAGQVAADPETTSHLHINR